MAFLYPWGNTQQLNLDWILQKIKELEAESGGADIDEVAEALLAASYRAQAYNQFDIVFHDGKLYLANADIPAPGEAWTPAHWDEILLGGPVSALMQHVSNLDSDNVINDSQVTGDTVSDALDTLKDAIDNIPLDSDNVSNESQVTGDNVSDALDNLNDTITDIQGQISANIEDGNTSTRTYTVGQYLIWKGNFYRVIAAIGIGDSFTINTNITATTIGNELHPISVDIASLNTDVSITKKKVYKEGNLVNIAIEFNVANNIASNVDILDGFPAPSSLTYIFGSTVTATPHLFYILSTGRLRPSGALPAGDWILMSTYMCI